MVRVRSADVFERVAPPIAEVALRRVRAACESATLRKALAIQREGRSIFIGVPHYWAIFYNDDRGPAEAPEGKFLIWFPNPRDDPRHHGNYPVRASQIQRLNIPPEELRILIETGVAVVARVSPRTMQRVRGKKFFEKGLKGFFGQGSPEGSRGFSQYMRDIGMVGKTEEFVLKISL